MKEKLADRRVGKTKRALTDALVQLVLEKGYEHVAVQDILDRANVGRSTFYSHFENKEQLLLAGPQNMQLQFMEARDAGENLDYAGLFAHLNEQEMMARALLANKVGQVMLDFIQGQICYQLQAKYQQHLKGMEMGKLRCMACAGAIVALVLAWFEAGRTQGVEEMARECERLELAILGS